MKPAAYERVRAACCDESLVDLDVHALLIARAVAAQHGHASDPLQLTLPLDDDVEAA